VGLVEHPAGVHLGLGQHFVTITAGSLGDLTAVLLGITNTSACVPTCKPARKRMRRVSNRMSV
jgi:hypothetical protein